VLRSLSVNDLPVGRNPDEVLRQVQVRACLRHLSACGLAAQRLQRRNAGVQVHRPQWQSGLPRWMAPREEDDGASAEGV